MKNFFICLVFVAVISAILQQFLPWWIIALSGFIAGYTIKQPTLQAFASGFAAIFLLWIVYAYMLSHGNDDLLAKKVAMLLPLKGHVSLLFLVTGIIGGLVSGTATLTGRLAATLNSN